MTHQHPCPRVSPAARRHLTRYITSVALLALATPSSTLHAAAPTSLVRVGIYDADHTGPSGYQFSDVSQLSPAGWIAGMSVDFSRTVFDSEYWSYTGWVRDPQGGMRLVGLRDALHTRTDGHRSTAVYFVNDQGVVVGTSSRFTGMIHSGASAWIEDRWGNRVKIGLYDAAHTSSVEGAPYKYNQPLALNQRNQVIGYSLKADRRYATGWLANSVGRIDLLGFSDAAHTGPDGTTRSMPIALNDAGHVIGNSRHFVAGAPQEGSTAWVRMPWGAHRRVGLETGIHRTSLGQHTVAVERITHSGYMGGISRRYRPSGDLYVGQTAWLTHVDGPNRPVGFYTGVHTSRQLVAYNQIQRINEAGIALGTSRQYVDSEYRSDAHRGVSAWMATPDGATVRVGLYDADHSNGSFQRNEGSALNGIDSAVGAAERFSGTVSLGYDAWVANIRGQTTMLGLQDARHIRPDGFRYAGATHINDTGWVAGFNLRYQDASDRGQTAWRYHRATRTYHAFVLSEADDGTARSQITFLGDDGFVAGVFLRYAADGTYLGEEAFYDAPDSGTVVLADQFPEAMLAYEWDQLTAPIYRDSAGWLIGRALGYSEPGSGLRQQSVYLAQP